MLVVKSIDDNGLKYFISILFMLGKSIVVFITCPVISPQKLKYKEKCKQCLLFHTIEIAFDFYLSSSYFFTTSPQWTLFHLCSFHFYLLHPLEFYCLFFLTYIFTHKERCILLNLYSEWPRDCWKF